jgi:16S rRNA (uracil1498-N3)-methyltransferase
MRIHRFLVDIPLSEHEGSIKDKELIHQLTRVLRLQKGDQIELFNKEGEEAKVLITEMDERWVDFMVMEKSKKEPETKRVVLAAAIVKRDNFEWIVQKATEIGVAEIIPLHTERSVKFGVQIHRLKRIVEEASEQCGRVSVPIVREPEEFMNILKESKEQEKYFVDMGGKNFIKAKKGDSMILFVGPEGGWSENERKAAKEAGCVTMSLGKTVLRSETAATVASYIAVNT